MTMVESWAKTDAGTASAAANTKAADLIALSFTSAAGESADDEKRLRSGHNRARQRRIRQFVGEISSHAKNLTKGRRSFVS